MTNPFGGRSHIKFTVINNLVYIGGCNLDSVRQIDVMAAWEDAASADFLDGLANRLLAAGSAKSAFAGEDGLREIGQDVSLMWDAGVRGRSLIYQRALKLIDEAQERIFFTCQYFPTKEIGTRLNQAYKRGVKVKIVYNHPANHNWRNTVLFRGVLAGERRRLPAEFFEHPVRPPKSYLHAKVLATERAAILGSHNLVEPGINFGTAEIAMLVEDTAFSQSLTQAVERQLT